MSAQVELNRIVVSSGKNPTQFAIYIGVSAPTINRILSGKTKSISRSLANKIVEYYPSENVEHLVASHTYQGIVSAKNTKESFNVEDEFMFKESLVTINDNFKEAMKDPAFNNNVEVYVAKRVLYLMTNKEALEEWIGGGNE
jgi:transcriptional regulator with XRE-family HTH domain